MENLTRENHFNFKAVVGLVTVCVLLSFFIPAGRVQAGGACPLPYQSGRTIATFPAKALYANQTESDAKSGPVSTWIPAGLYNITLVSYDDGHAPGYQPWQTQESFYLILRNSQGNVIVNTPAISDLPDELKILTEQVATNFSIAQNVSSIIAFHAAYPSGGAHSIGAICAAFDKIPTNPAITITKSVDKTSANPGEEIVYTINYQNTGDVALTGVVIRDPFINQNQQYLTFISATPSPDSGNDTWTLATSLPVGGSGTIAIRARISNNVPIGTTEIKNRANIDSNETPLTYSNYVSTTVTNTPANPACSISANPSSIVRGQSSILSWTSQNANSCLAFNGWSGTKPLSGTQSVSPSYSATYSLSCSNSIGVSVTCSTLVTVTEPDNPNLVITKSVNKAQANPGDEIVYTLNYSNTGQGAANSVVISDPFNNLNQQYLTFISAIPVPSYGQTWNIGTLNAGQSGTITIRAKISNDVPTGYTQIQNRANIDSNETDLQYSNYVGTWIYKDSESISLSIEKLVRNISDGTGFRSSVDADQREEIEFSLEIRNTSNNITRNVRVWDNLPKGLEYVSGSTTVDGSYRGDGIIGSGINIGDINANGSKLVKFKARVEDYSYYGTVVLTNYGYAVADNYQTIYDTATVRVEYEDQGSPNLNIDKLVRNISRGYGYWTTSVYAQPNDEIEFLIKINSIGNRTAENVKVKDSLPSKLTYISGSTTVDGSYRSDGIISSNGIYVDNLAVGNYREVKFKVRAASTDNFGPGTTTLTNYGYTWADEISQISDTAQVLVQKEETPQPTRAISINKLGRNISQGESVWLDSVLASPSQEIEFSIQVTNIGNSNLTNVKVWDNLPANISVISNSTTIDGVSWGGDVVGPGLNLGTLTQGQTKTIKFRAKIANEDNFGAGSTTLINTAYTSADNISQISDQALVVVIKPGEVRGAEYVPTGANTIGLGFLGLGSAFIAFMIYCRTREEKLLDILNSEKSNKLVKAFIKLYFRVKFFITATKLRFKQIYW